MRTDLFGKLYVQLCFLGTGCMLVPQIFIYIYIHTKLPFVPFQGSVNFPGWIWFDLGILSLNKSPFESFNGHIHLTQNRRGAFWRSSFRYAEFLGKLSLCHAVKSNAEMYKTIHIPHGSNDHQKQYNLLDLIINGTCRWFINLLTH